MLTLAPPIVLAPAAGDVVAASVPHRVHGPGGPVLPDEAFAAAVEAIEGTPAR